MQHVVQSNGDDIKLDIDIDSSSKINSYTPCTPPYSPPYSPPSSPPHPAILSDAFRYLSESSVGSVDEEDIAEVGPFLINPDDLTEESQAKLLLPFEDADRTVDPETQARLQSLLKAAGITKITTGDGKQLADPEVLRRLTSSVSCALDEAAAALTKMRSDSRQASKRALVNACTQGNVSAVRKLLKQGMSVNETSEEGDSLLSIACGGGHYELTQVLLAANANVDDRGSKGDCTPLMEASSAGYVDIVRLLLAHGADVNAQSSTGNTSLMYSCSSGQSQTVKVLLDAGANVEEHNENGHTPLMEAASAGYVDVAKMLLEQGAGINTHSNEFKESALTLACYKGHLDMVKFLLRSGADQEHKTDEMHTALMEASMDGHVPVAKVLLDSGAQVNMPTDSFESPLTLAACGGHIDLALLLLERGANIEEVNDEGYSPLMEAAREGHEEMVAVLLEKGAHINAQTDETQETALTLACCGGFLEVVDYLVKHNANLELGASTPLMEASQEGHLEIVRYLLEAGSNVHARTLTHDTALTYACENGHTDIVDLLLQYGADLEGQAEGGRTPLMKACRAGHLCTVQFLIGKGANINHQTTNNDHTPLSLACSGGHLSIVQYLLDHNANRFHKLKDNATMVIEAAKGGHTSVVQLLLDSPDAADPVTTPSVITTPNASVITTTTSPVPASKVITAVKGAVNQNIVKQVNDVNKNAGQQRKARLNKSGDNRENAVPPKDDVKNDKKCDLKPVAQQPQQPQQPQNAIQQQQLQQLQLKQQKQQQELQQKQQQELKQRQQQLLQQKTQLQQQKQQLQQKLQQPQQQPQQQQLQQPQQQQLQQPQQQQLQQPQQQQPQQPQQQQLQQPQQQVQQPQQQVQQPQQQVQQPQQQVQQIQQQQPQQQTIDPIQQQQLPMQTTIQRAKQSFMNISPIEQKFLETVEQELKETKNIAGIAVSSSIIPVPVTAFDSSSELTSTLLQGMQGNTSALRTAFSLNSSPISSPISLSSSISTSSLVSTITENITNLPPPPLIPINDILQSIAISDRPKAKPSKKDGKLGVRKQVLAQSVQQQQPLGGSQLPAQKQQQQQQQQQISPSANKQPQQEHQQALHQQSLQQQQSTLQQQQQSIQQLMHHQVQIQQYQKQLLDQPDETMLVSQAAAYQAAIHQQQQAQALHLKHLAQINAQLQQQVSQQVHTAQPQSQQMNQMSFLNNLANLPISCHTINEIFTREQLLAQIHLLDATVSSATKQNFPKGVTDNDILKEIRSMQDMLSSDVMPHDVIPDSLRQCHFLTSIAEDEVWNMNKIKSSENEQLNMETFTMEEINEVDGIVNSALGKSVGCNMVSPIQMVSTEQNHVQYFSVPTSYSTCVVPQQQSPPPQQSQQQTLEQQQEQQKQHIQQQEQEMQFIHQQLKQQLEQQQMQELQELQANHQKQYQLHRQQLLQKQQQQPQPQQQQQQSNPQSKSNTQSHPFSQSSLSNKAKQELHKHLHDLKKSQPSKSSKSKATTSDAGSSAISAAANIPATSTTTVNKKSHTSSTQLHRGKKVRYNTQQRVPAIGSIHNIPDTNNTKHSNSNNSQSQSSSGKLNPMDVDCETESNRDTALTLACAGGHEELVRLLLAKGSDIEHRDKKGFTPLILAATAGHEKIVDLLLNHNASIEATSDRTKDTPLSLACSGGRYEVVELLIGRGANKEHRNVSDYTPLSLAASGGYVNIIKLLLSNGAEINSRTGSKLGISPLMLAAMNGHTAAVKILLDMGSDINAQIETNRNTALTLACFQGRHEVVSLLLDRKANVEHRAKTGLTPLMEAASGGYVDVGRVLLDKGADVNATPVPSSRDTALTIASDKGHGRFVELLLQRHAQVEVKNKKGNSPLWLAANGGHLCVVELLYSVGANIDSQDNRRVSCLMAAFRKGHLKVVKWMVTRVMQFPSDKEMTRYITTINDRDLLDKCQECMTIIKQVKDTQAVKANKVATILLEEVDLEKAREETKRLAAERRRERKRMKKLEKKGSKSKPKENEVEEDSKDEDDDEEFLLENTKSRKDAKGKDNSSLLDSAPRRNNNNVDIEELDSGIDASSLGSCSSNEVKLVTIDRVVKEKKNKKQNLNNPKSTQSSSKKKENRDTETQQNHPPQNSKNKEKKHTSSMVTNNNASNNNSQSSNNSKQSGNKKDRNNENLIKANNKSEKQNNVSSETTNNKSNSNVHSEKKNKNNNNVKLVFESTNHSKHPAERDDFEATGNETISKKKKQTSFFLDESNFTSSKLENSVTVPSLPSSAFASAGLTVISANGKPISNLKREEGWKEVVIRKNISSPYRAKKVSVPLNAISRVIGRAGCNINAVRSATGAHIEIEKQSKGQGERIITIKGSNEATKQAHVLISTLIDDPDADITLMLPKSVKIPPPAWEKTNASNKGKFNATGSLNNNVTKPSQSIHQVTPITSQAISSFSKPSFPPPQIASSVAVTSSFAPMIRTSLTMTRPGAPRIAPSTSYEKKPVAINVMHTAVVTTVQSTTIIVTSTKTTMSYTSAIISSGNKGQKVISTVTATATTTQTFAAKLSESVSLAKDASQVPPMPCLVSSSVYIRPTVTAPSAPANSSISSTPNKPPFSAPSSSAFTGAFSSFTIQPIPSSAQQTQIQQSYPVSTSNTVIVTTLESIQPKVTNVHISSATSTGAITSNNNLLSPTLNITPEYSLFNDTFSKVTQQTVWGRDSGSDSNNNKGINFTGVASSSSCSASAVVPTVHPNFMEFDPPILIDASKAPGYRGSTACSPNVQKSSSSSASVSPNPSSFNVNRPIEVPSSIAIARPSSIPASIESHTFTPRALFPEKPCSSFSRDLGPSMSDTNSSFLSHFHPSLSYTQPQATTTVSMSRLNPRAPDFSTTIKLPPPLPPTHQPPPPIFNQNQPPPSFISAQQGPLNNSIPNTNISFPINKYPHHPQSQQRPNQSQWMYINSSQQPSFHHQDMVNFSAPTTLNNLMQGQNHDILSSLENSMNSINISQNSNPNMSHNMSDLHVNERKIPRPIGTERAWRNDRDRSLPLEQDHKNWLMEQNLPWTSQVYRSNPPPPINTAATATPTVPVHNTDNQFSRMHMSDDIRQTMLDNTYQNEHFNGVLANPATQIPPLMQPMNISHGNSAHMTGPTSHEIGHSNSFKMESNWDPNRLCISDIPQLDIEKQHHPHPVQPQTQGWTLPWNH